MLFAYSGETYTSYFGFRFKKLYVPWLLLIMTKILVPESTFTGHLFGIIAALFLKYGGFYQMRLLPQFAWIEAYESLSCFTNCCNVTYYKAN